MGGFSYSPMQRADTRELQMKPSTARIIGAFSIGIALIAAGLILGFTPIHREGASCGSAFLKNDSASQGVDLTNTSVDKLSAISDACDAARSDRSPIAWVLLVPGGVALLIGLVALVVVDAKNIRSRTI